MIGSITRKIGGYFIKGHERTLAAKKNIAYSFLLKVGSVVISFVLVPMTIHYVNPVDYGVWLTLSSIINWFSFFDIGLGNGLKNKLTESNAIGQFDKSRIYVSTTYAILAILSILLFLAFFIANHFLNWASILNIPANLKENLNNLALIVFATFCVRFVVQLVNVVLTACHEPAKASFIALLGQIASLIIILVLTKTTQGSLLYLLLGLAVAPLLVMIIYSVYLYGYKAKYKLLTPSFTHVDFKYGKALLTLGGVFFIIQMGQLVLFQTDNIIIAQLFGPKDVTVFNISYKVFSVVSIVFGILMSPLWSSFTDAYARHDMEWIRNIFYKMQKIWGAISLGTIFLLLASPLIFKIWLGDLVKVPFSLSFAIALSVIGSTWHLLCCILLNGINKIRLQLYLYVICFIVNIPIALFLGKLIGITGIVYSNIVVYIFMGLVFYIQCNKILKGKAQGIWNK